MTYLEIIRKVCNKIGYDPPVSMALAGDDGKLVASWVQQVWIEIQEYHARWGWMLRRTRSPLFPGNVDYTLADLGLDDLECLISHSFLYTDASDQYLGTAKYMPTDMLLDKELKEGPAMAGVPVWISFVGGVFHVYPEPDKPYKVLFKYKINPVVLVADTDIPDIPVGLTDIIFEAAMIKYAISDNSPEDFTYSDGQYRIYLNRLMRIAAPAYTMSSRTSNSSRPKTEWGI